MCPISLQHPNLVSLRSFPRQERVGEPVGIDVVVDCVGEVLTTCVVIFSVVVVLSVGVVVCCVLLVIFAVVGDVVGHDRPPGVSLGMYT